MTHASHTPNTQPRCPGRQAPNLQIPFHTLQDHEDSESENVVSFGAVTARNGEEVLDTEGQAWDDHAVDHAQVITCEEGGDGA